MLNSRNNKLDIVVILVVKSVVPHLVAAQQAKKQSNTDLSSRDIVTYMQLAVIASVGRTPPSDHFVAKTLIAERQAIASIAPIPAQSVGA